MTDLRTAAQAVLASYDESEDDMPSFDSKIETLRQAVEQAKGVEAVGRILVWKGSKSAPLYEKLTIRSYEEFPESRTSEKDCPWENSSPVYTTPPSLDALIADLMELHLTWEDYQDVKEVCDKYRSNK